MENKFLDDNFLNCQYHFGLNFMTGTKFPLGHKVLKGEKSHKQARCNYVKLNFHLKLGQ